MGYHLAGAPFCRKQQESNLEPGIESTWNRTGRTGLGTEPNRTASSGEDNNYLYNSVPLLVGTDRGEPHYLYNSVPLLVGTNMGDYLLLPTTYYYTPDV